MSQIDMDSLQVFAKTLKKGIRFWWMSMLFFYGSILGSLSVANSFNPTIGTLLFIISFIILVILYFKNGHKTIVLRTSLRDFSDVKRIPTLANSFKQLETLATIIFFLDFAIWPFTVFIKLLFWFFYRVFKRRLKKMKKLMTEGEKIFKDEDIESDPFYSFLMQEGLYEKPKKKNILEEHMEEPESKDEGYEADDEKLSDMGVSG